MIPEKSDQIARRNKKGSRGGRPPHFDVEMYRDRNVGHPKGVFTTTALIVEAVGARLTVGPEPRQLRCSRPLGH